MKGCNFLNIQIQHLSISWFDTIQDEYFEVFVNGRPDDFIMKDVEIYEMLNRMYYPISNKVWTLEGVKEFEQKQKMLEIFLIV